MLEPKDGITWWKVENPTELKNPLETKSKTLLLLTPLPISIAKEFLQITRLCFIWLSFSLCTFIYVIWS